MNQISGIANRVPIIGRDSELKYLNNCLHDRGANHAVYYWARGGLGKTRLLEELQRMIQDAGEDFFTSGIIDLYHTDMHSNSDVERAIIDGLDPTNKHFKEYRKKRYDFQLLRERGSDPQVLEQRRERLSEDFVKEALALAHDANKLVLCFDTMEVLQYETGTVEARAGLDTVDTRVRNWMLRHLPQLRNVLIVFAGRPKGGSTEQTINHHDRLIEDLTKAFGKKLVCQELSPLNLQNTRKFLKSLSPPDDAPLVPDDLLPIVHLLTGGRPIFLHLLADQLRELGAEPGNLLAMFEEQKHLLDLPEDDERIVAVRTEVEESIVKALFSADYEHGAILEVMAMLPKGADSEILQTVGITRREADAWLENVGELSIIKRHKEPRTSNDTETEVLEPVPFTPHAARTFLHEEVYRLLTPELLPWVTLRERERAFAINAGYYNPRIAKLSADIETAVEPKLRIRLRRQWQKLMVERLYYMLVQSPADGYAEYMRLSDIANRQRWVGFAMRLLDEFLRYYNEPGRTLGAPPRRRPIAEANGVTHARVKRESAAMWVERFFWWGKFDRTADFAKQILQKPSEFSVEPVEHTTLLGSVCARLTDAVATMRGFDDEILQIAQDYLHHLPDTLEDCTFEQALARARLGTAIGLMYSSGGMLQMATQHYANAHAAFRFLQDFDDERSKLHRDELAMLLNSLAFTYAKLGQLELAFPLVDEALKINEALGSDYSTGLTLSTLAAITSIAGRYHEAIEYGEEALDKFQELEERNGIAMATLSVAHAQRRNAKRMIAQGRRLGAAEKVLTQVIEDLKTTLATAEKAELELRAGQLRGELGRANRDLGEVVSRTQNTQAETPYFNRSKAYLNAALNSARLGIVDKADLQQDLAEVHVLSGDIDEARNCLAKAEQLIGEDHLMKPNQHVPDGRFTERFLPLAKSERLRGEIAFQNGDFAEGLMHYARAYAYHNLYSPEALEKDPLIRYLYEPIRGLPVATQQGLLEKLQKDTQKYNANLGMAGFVQSLRQLLGL